MDDWQRAVRFSLPGRPVAHDRLSITKGGIRPSTERWQLMRLKKLLGVFACAYLAVGCGQATSTPPASSTPIVLPSATPTVSPTATATMSVPTSTPTTPIATPTATATATPPPTATSTATATPTPTATPTATITPTSTPTPLPPYVPPTVEELRERLAFVFETNPVTVSEVTVFGETTRVEERSYRAEALEIFKRATICSPVPPLRVRAGFRRYSLRMSMTSLSISVAEGILFSRHRFSDGAA